MSSNTRSRNLIVNKDENRGGSGVYYGKIASTPSNQASTDPKFAFPSPTESASFIQGEIENHLINGSDLTVHSVVNSSSSASHQNRIHNKTSTIPLLTNHNFNNISSNNTSASNINTNDNPDIISCQRVRKIVIANESSTEILRAKEEYLNQLKSIDLNKFSFPNETKPRTDYTYAKTSSYLKESKSVNDNCEMPNLCRRGRKSPQQLQQQNLLLNSSQTNTNNNNNNNLSNSLLTSSGSKKNLFTLFSSHSNINDFNRETNNQIELSEKRSNWYSYIINMFSSSSKKNANQTTSNFNINQMSTMNQLNPRTVNSINNKLNKNLLQDLDDENQNNNRSFTLRHGYGLDGESTATGGSQTDGATTSSAVSSQATLTRTTSTNTYNLRNRRTNEENIFSQQQNNSDAVQTANFNNQNNNLERRRVEDRRNRICSPWLLLLMLLLFIGAGFFAYKSFDTSGLFERLNSLKKIEKDDLTHTIDNLKQKGEPLIHQFKTYGQQINYYYEHVKSNYLQPYFNQETWYLFKEKSQDYLKILYNYCSSLLSLLYEYTLILKQKSYDFYVYLSQKKDELSKKPIIDYKLSTTNLHNQDIIDQLNKIKENILAEHLLKSEENKNSKLADVEQLRQELDQKFNFTLTLMSNKLADQLMQHEQSKSSHEKELKQIKEVLNQLQTDYRLLVEKQQQIISNQQKLVEQQQASTTTTPANTLNENDQTKELISFKKIEEFINKSFFLYNADRTGMTDFASESLGASILFTRCTENYMHNSRWFTFFNVPISRITVSPRVVIQGTIQPGNCWAFKGDKADLFIKLAAPIMPKSFSIEHIPKELSLTGLIDSAPQNFTVYGFVNPDDISDEKRLILGNFRYDNTSKNTLQFFNAQHQYNDKPIAAVELKIESNAGNPDYTCLYKFRVHGNLFNMKDFQQKQQEDSSNNLAGENSQQISDDQSQVNSN